MYNCHRTTYLIFSKIHIGSNDDRNAHCPIGLRFFTCRHLPTNEKILFLCVLSVYVVKERFLSNGIDLLSDTH